MTKRQNFVVYRWRGMRLHFSGKRSVSRTFWSEIADFSPIYRQIRQVFGPKSRKILQFLAIFVIIFTPYSKEFQVLLHFYASTFLKNGFSQKKMNFKKIFIKIYYSFGSFKNFDFLRVFTCFFLVKVK